VLLDVEDLEEVELDVAQVAPEVAHRMPFYPSVTSLYYSPVTSASGHG
jgi:hypothetical protein